MWLTLGCHVMSNETTLPKKNWMHVVISLLRLTYHLIMSLRTKVLDIWHLKVQNQDSDCGGCRCQVDAPSRWFFCRTGSDARWGSGYGCSGGHWCCSCWRIVTEVILAAVAITSMYPATSRALRGIYNPTDLVMVLWGTNGLNSAV